MLIVADRAARLAQYQDNRYAQRYRRQMDALAQALNARRLPPALLLQVADILYRLLAVKDEYEVARLLASPSLAAEVAASFEAGATITFQLAPSWLPGRSNDSGKYSLGGWARPVLRLLAALRFARGTLLDPFRLHAERRMEHEVRRLFAADLQEAIDRIDAANFEFHRARLAAAGEIRGYGSVKMKKMREYLQRRAVPRADEDRQAPAQKQG